VEGGNHRVELLGHRAHRGRADRPSEDGQQRLAHLAHRQPENEARQDHAIDLFGTPRVGTDHRNRREPARARHRQLDIPELGQQMAPVATVAAIGFSARGHPFKVLIDRLAHLTL
jgi:hypothetical protein